MKLRCKSCNGIVVYIGGRIGGPSDSECINCGAINNHVDPKAPADPAPHESDSEGGEL